MENNNNIELYLLKLFIQDISFYTKYSSFVRKKFVSDNNTILGKLFDCVSHFYEKHPDQKLSTQDLPILYQSLFPTASPTDSELLGKIVSQIGNIEAKSDLAEQYLNAHLERVKATEFALQALKVGEGKESFASLVEATKGLTQTDQEAKKEDFVTDDLGLLLDSQITKPGLRWRLKIMNQMLGSLRQGDFGFLFKRPETGGTTFLASEVTYMAPQAERPILWVNNEEQGQKVLIRCYEAHFGIPLSELVKNRDYYQKKYLEVLGGRIKLYDSPLTNKREVERLCQSLQPSLIIFDQIDKVKGFSNDMPTLELKEIYQWARELSKNYGPVIGVCQASVSAEGKKWLTMDDVDASKTAKQGEADWMLGIGKTHQDGFENVRHLHLVKNKLIGDSDTLPEMRHGKADVRIIPEIARYEDYK